ncbi:diaminopimelate epimerase [Isoptericola cucumis]|uniref:Diaminopimelate epimerase n=1 Tax=Isoptericola cucumis TaxID=1776856 RepID=A0ABQ2B6K1_9MICO|nr:diaminopimelate epimerase [Isoptericola cucumis]GGI07865.1 diaminopimelate epimerase [Isoptericola cucumis]
MTLRFTKGHGTQNDFVLLADTRGDLGLTADQVRCLTDRRAGVGADGVIRLVPTAAIARAGEEVADRVLAEEPEAIWFMDYRNADGSVAQMCGNGVRVFAAFAEHLGLADLTTGELVLGTRAGVRRVRRDPDGWYAVDMGAWALPGGQDAVESGADSQVLVAGWPTPRPALSVDLGNPHTVVALPEVDDLTAADLTQVPQVDPRPVEGTNVELVVPLAEGTDAAGRPVGRVRMRVHERGVGETLSCGTGACAAALAVRTWAGHGSAQVPDVWEVEVPGGRVRVTVLPDGHVELAGPAELVFTGEVDLH